MTRLLRWSSKLGARFAVGIGTIMAIRRNEKGNGEPGVRFSPSGPYFYTGCGRRRFPKTDAVFKIRTRAHREQECLRMSFGRKGKHIEERLFPLALCGSEKVCQKGKGQPSNRRRAHESHCTVDIDLSGTDDAGPPVRPPPQRARRDLRGRHFLWRAPLCQAAGKGFRGVPQPRGNRRCHPADAQKAGRGGQNTHL